MTYSGSFAPLMELPPRILMLTELPGCPDDCVTCTPAARPCKARSSELMGTPLRSPVEMDDTEPVKSPFFCVPYPITTT
ncbi:hypothetical protein D3C87_1668620 [compost metagenome]